MSAIVILGAVIFAIIMIGALLLLAFRLTERKSSAELAKGRTDASDIHGGGEYNVHVGLPGGGGAD